MNIPELIKLENTGTKISLETIYQQKLRIINRIIDIDISLSKLAKIEEVIAEQEFELIQI